MKIKKLTAKHILQIVEIWQQSVEATHDFLQKEDIAFYRPFVFEALKAISVYGLVGPKEEIGGFIGIQGETVEALFLRPDLRGKGYGKMLLEWAIGKFNIRYVDVNEQNTAARKFYEKAGFEVESRDATDGYGKPYPILHLRLRQEIEEHPLGFFLPENSRLLMLGSFPPPRQRWSMNFYYPNILNDMWRILGLLFYADKDYFLASPKAFCEEKAKRFCRETGIGIGDTGVKIIRRQGNASDKFLEIVEPINPKAVLEQIPTCQAIVVTGEKALQTLLSVLPPMPAPVVGSFTEFTFIGRTFRLYRMPSSSRAYPKPLEEKADIYRRMFIELGMIDVETHGGASLHLRSR